MKKSKRSLRKSLKRFGERFSHRRSSWQLTPPRSRFLQLEPLEQRHLLSGTSYEVDSLADVVANDGYITLREAIQAANTNTAVYDAPAGSAVDTDYISFDSSLFSGGPQTITLGGTQLSISDDLNIYGPGAGSLTIDGNDASRVFSISNGATASIECMTISGGYTADRGGGVYTGSDTTLFMSEFIITDCEAEDHGGGIYAYGDLDIFSATLSENTSGNYGGAIGTTGELSLDSVTISDNTAAVHAGGVYGSVTSEIEINYGDFSGNTAGSHGGAVFTAGTSFDVDMLTTFDDNEAAYGGAIYLYYCSDATITLATFSDNHATTSGGAIGTNSSTFEISDTNIIGNSAAGSSGGGINSGNGSTLTLINSVVANNTAASYGGGIYGGSMTLTNATIAGNYAGNSGGGVCEGGTLTANNTIISLNEAGVASDNLYGSVSSGDNNRIDHTSANLAFVTDPDAGVDDTWGTSDDVFGNLRLSPGSNAIDNGNNTAASGISGDLDGNSRVVNDTVDIGAYEYQGAIVVTAEEDDDENDPYNLEVSLREALAIADDWAGADTIAFNLVHGYITLDPAKGQLEIDSNMTIDGSGDLGPTTIDGNDACRVFSISSGVEAEISDMTITGGYATGTGTDAYGGGIYVAGSDSTLDLYGVTITYCEADDYGGGIYNYGTLNIDASTTLSENQADNGGAIYTYRDLNVTGSTIEDNDAVYGAGIFGAGVSAITIDGSADLSGNTATGRGGAICIYYGGDLDVSGSVTFSDNAADRGGAIYMEDSNDANTVSGATFSGNNVSSYGGAICLDNSTLAISDTSIKGNWSTGSSGGSLFSGNGSALTVVNSVVANNSAASSGGGVYVGSTSALTLTNATIAGNYATNSGGGVCIASGGTLTANNTIIAINDAGVASDNLYGSVSSGANNITSGDPGFVTDPGYGKDASYGDLHLDGDSSAINAGNNTAASGITYDLDGNDRIIYETVDIGAYEYISDWTFMVYMCADDDSEIYAVFDFLEMADIGSTNAVNIVVQMDPENELYGYGWTGTRRGRVEYNDVPNSSWGSALGEVDMGDPDSAIDFIEWAVDDYPAEKYAIVFWGLSNAYQYVCADFDSSNDLSMADLSDVFADVDVPHMDLIGFDANRMGMTEVAYQLRDAGDVMVASETNKRANGWDYQNSLDDLVATPGQNAATLAGHIIDAFEDYYYIPIEEDLAAIDLTEIGDLGDALEDFADTLLNDYLWSDNQANEDVWQAVWDVRDNIGWSLNEYYNGWQVAIFDLGGYMDDLLADLAENNSDPAVAVKAAATAVNNALNDAVVDEYHSSTLDGDLNGLTMYFPEEGIDSDYNDTIDFVFDTQWDDLLDEMLTFAS